METGVDEDLPTTSLGPRYTYSVGTDDWIISNHVAISEINHNGLDAGPATTGIESFSTTLAAAGHAAPSQDGIYSTSKSAFEPITHMPKTFSAETNHSAKRTSLSGTDSRFFTTTSPTTSTSPSSLRNLQPSPRQGNASPTDFQSPMNIALIVVISCVVFVSAVVSLLYVRLRKRVLALGIRSWYVSQISQRRSYRSDRSFTGCASSVVSRAELETYSSPRELDGADWKRELEEEP
ncbi:MAG: hypothetical protein MMC23_009514 [Stictis urceolatum]|nr:hypothetical protein [Stictis urceolata]